MNLESATTVLEAAMPFPAPIAVWLLGGVSTLCWVMLHVLGRPGRPLPVRAAVLLLGHGLASLACGAALRTLGSYIVLATPWSPWVLGIMAGTGIETIYGLYAFERESLPRALGRFLVFCRAAGLALIVLLLAQPVRTWTIDRLRERVVAVVIDDSNSMRGPDFCLNPSETLRLARLFGVDTSIDTAGIYRCGESVKNSAGILAAFNQWLDAGSHIPATLLNERFESYREQALQELTGAQAAITEQVAFLSTLPAADSVISPAVKKRVNNQRDRLASIAGTGIEGALKILRDTPEGQLPGQAAALTTLAAGVADGLTAVSAEMITLCSDIETFQYYRLPEDMRAQIGSVARRSRLSVVDSLLTGDDISGTKGLLPELSDKYTVQSYRFASSVSAIDYMHARKAEDDTANRKGTEHNATDISGAVLKALEGTPREKLAGIVLLSDGLNNGLHDAASLSGRLRAQRIPVNTVLVGGTHDPPDAGISGVDAPGTVQTGDQVLFRTAVYLDRMKGRKARVTLTHEDKELAVKDLDVQTDAFRAELTFTDKPGTLGSRTYTVAVTLFDDEVIIHNNSRQVHVSVLEHATTFLLVDDRPRWEYRYLKNLFLREFNTIRIQHVLLRPDNIDGIPPPSVVHASASRPKGQAEATALPAGEEEWLKFDVVFLGDVSPQQIGEAGIEALRKYVVQGGTLVIIAGENEMPRSYARSRLADLFPVVLDPARPSAAANSFPDGFTIARTAEGLTHVILRQDDRRERDREIWSGFPRLYWRLLVKDTKPGATVLAYAVPKKIPEFLYPAGETTGPGAEERSRLRRQFQRSNPLIVSHKYEGGRVLMLCTDRMWRLRHGQGDVHHHKFWGQVIRWASPEPLQAGTKLVRMGADRTEYSPGDTVRVRATVASAGDKPVTGGTVNVTVFDADNLVTTRKMEGSAWREGMYECEIDGLAAEKTYRLVLGGASVVDALAKEGIEQAVEAEIRFAPETGPETERLAASSAFVSELAAASGGVVVDPTSSAGVLENLPEGTQILKEQKQFPLWTWWPLFAAMLILFSAEWMARKRMGLT